MSVTKTELEARIEELEEEKEELQDRLDGEGCGDDEYDADEALVGA